MDFSSDTDLIEYLDYAFCTATGNAVANDGDGDEDYWICQLYLPKRSEQVDGYPRFDYPGVIKGHFINSVLPTLEEVSYSSVTSFLQSQGVNSTTTYAAALLAAVSTLMF